MIKRIRQLILVLTALVTGLIPVSVLAPIVKASPAITEYYITTGNSSTNRPESIITGPDGTLWFTNPQVSTLGRLTTAGAFTAYGIGQITNVVVGPDGAIWGTEPYTSNIARVTTSGTKIEYPIVSCVHSPNCWPFSITVGPDAALWFTEAESNIGNDIGRITTAGAITTYSLPFNVEPLNITSGSDGALWFTAVETGSSTSVTYRVIGRISTSGVVTIFVPPTTDSYVSDITSGPDGALWFTEPGSNKIGRITTSGDVTEFPLTSTNPQPLNITSGPDGALWFTESGAGRIGRITTTGAITEYPLPNPNYVAFGITTGPDGAVWFTENNGNRIGRITTPVPGAPVNLAISSPAQNPILNWSAASGVTSYNIYRGSTNIASVPAPAGSTVTYTDTTAPEGTNTYHVTAVNSSGESQPSNSVSVLVDRTGPTVTGTPDSSPNSNGWYNHGVTINWSSTDPSPSSGTPTQPAPTTASLEGTNIYTSDQSCDPVNNCSTGSLSLNIDKTAPTISYTVTPTPNFSNWLNSDATVTFTCADATSGIDSCSAPVTITSDGGNQTVTGTAFDKAGNTATITATVNLDKTAPLISSSFSQAPNANGWNNAPVTVSYTCTDATSGIASCSSPQTESADGSYSLTGTATDNAGNSSTTTTQVNVDQTAPDITYTVSPTLNSNGWTTSSAATVTFTCSDATSGIDTCTSPVTVTGDGAYVVTGTAVDKAGNTTSVNALIGIDTTPPTITANVSPAPNANGWNNSGPVTVTFTCSDAMSGIQSCPAPQTISSDGSYTLSGTAVDNAGNTATTLVTVNLDQTAPIVTNIAWSTNPLQQGQNTTLSATVTDNLSGPASVYYTIDGGTPQAMTFNATSGTWQATFGASLASNTYTINVYAVDNAGNTSASYTDVLTVSSNSVVSGHAKLTPAASDTLPIALDTATHNPTEFSLGFSGNNNGPNSIEAHYVVKNNKDEFDFSSTTVDWVVVPDLTHASIMVHGTMTTYVGGVQTITNNVAMLVDVTLGTNGGSDQITVSLWMPGQDPSTTLPSYQVSEPDLANKSMITIR